MKRLTKIIIVFLILAIAVSLPVIAGYAEFPRKFTPKECINFIKGIMSYWYEFIEYVMKEIVKYISQE